MPKSSPMFEDLISLGSSLFGNLVEARHEMKAQAKTHVENLTRKLDLVSREEFDAAFSMLAKMRMEQEELAERLARIEAHLGLSSTAKNKKRSKAPLPSVKQGKNRKTKK